MQSYSSPAGVATLEGCAGQLADGATTLNRTLDGPAPQRPAAVPKPPLRERLRRPLLILFPILLAAFGAAYYLAEEPYVATDDAFVRAAKESVNARVAGQVVEIA